VIDLSYQHVSVPIPSKTFYHALAEEMKIPVRVMSDENRTNVERDMKISVHVQYVHICTGNT